MIRNHLKITIHIRDLYQPIQPTIQQSEENVSYREFMPALPLQEYIYCYWQLKTTQKLDSAFHYKVVADGCIDIFFELQQPEDNFVMGFCKKYTEFPLANEFNYIGIRFLPTMFTQLFHIDAASLSNQYVSLDTVVPKVSHFIATHFYPEMTSDQIRSELDTYFSALLAPMRLELDKRLYNALQIILSNYGVLDIEKDLDTGISPRQLRRLFKYYIGDTAKTFCKVVQFQNILKAKPSSQSLKRNKLFYDIGYYDQSHFIKDFKNFYGVTPSKAFKR